MEYFILNKNLKIPSLGFYFSKNQKHELCYYPNYNLLSCDKLIIYLDLKNQYLEYYDSDRKNFYTAPFINNLSHLIELKHDFQFIIIDYIDMGLIKYCSQNHIFPILFFNYQKLMSDSKNKFLKNFNFLNQELIIRILIENNIIIVCEQNINNFKFELFLGELSDNLINEIKN
jgi:hypothetical protein